MPFVPSWVVKNGAGYDGFLGPQPPVDPGCPLTTIYIPAVELLRCCVWFVLAVPSLRPSSCMTMPHNRNLRCCVATVCTCDSGCRHRIYYLAKLAQLASHKRVFRRLALRQSIGAVHQFWWVTWPVFSQDSPRFALGKFV